MLGLIEYFSGRLFIEGLDGKFNSQQYQAFLQKVMDQTHEHLFLIQDGAKYHTSQSTRQFCAKHVERITVWQLLSYSPDYDPIDHLWRHVKKDVVANQPTPVLDITVQDARDYLSRLSPRQRLQKAGVLSDDSWLASILVC